MVYKAYDKRPLLVLNESAPMKDSFGLDPMNQHANLYNTGGLPPFEEPTSLQDARHRISELRLAIMSINDQIAYNQAAGNIDPLWLRKASTSRRFKTFEQERLENWLAANSSLAERVMEIVKPDYSEADWQQILTEARREG